MKKMQSLKTLLEIGDYTTAITKKTGEDPETGKISWDVSYSPNFTLILTLSFTNTVFIDIVAPRGYSNSLNSNKTYGIIDTSPPALLLVYIFKEDEEILLFIIDTSAFAFIDIT
jgi:hypothetical protein